LSRAEYGQGLAVRAKLRTDRFTGDEIRVGRQSRIKELLNRAPQGRWCDVLARRRLQRRDVLGVRRLGKRRHAEGHGSRRDAKHDQAKERSRC
jgi:hypothetical protein